MIDSYLQISDEMRLASCFVCREHVGDRTWCYTESSLFLEDKSWKKYYAIDLSNPNPVFVNAAELERKYFMPRGEAHWRHLYRLILYDFEKNRLIISGIGQYDRWATSNAAAKHSNKALIGKGKVNNKAEITGYYTSRQLGWWHEKPFYFSKDIDWHQLPLAIHMGCWKLAQWQLGPSIENNLELFIAIMLRISITSLSVLKGETYDAYRIVQVQELIEASRVSKKRKRKGRYFGFSRFLLLPTELLEIVLDHLTCKEIAKLEIAMGFLVADRYWRRRAAVFLVEMDEIADEDLDWRYLCRKWERISNGETFQDHHYIVGILRDQVKPTYMENLKERVFPSLKEIIAGT